MGGVGGFQSIIGGIKRIARQCLGRTRCIRVIDNGIRRRLNRRGRRRRRLRRKRQIQVLRGSDNPVSGGRGGRLRGIRRGQGVRGGTDAIGLELIEHALDGRRFAQFRVRAIHRGLRCRSRSRGIGGGFQGIQGTGIGDTVIGTAFRRGFSGLGLGRDIVRRDRGLGLERGGFRLRCLFGGDNRLCLDQRDGHGVLIAARIVDHLIQGHPAAVTERERRLIGELDTEGGILAGFQHVALIDRVTFLQRHAGAVGAGRFDLAFGGDNFTDWITGTGGRGLGVLARRQRTGEFDGELGLNQLAAFGDQIRGVLEPEEIADDDLLTIGARQDQVRPLADKVRTKHPSISRQRLDGAGLRFDDGDLAAWRRIPLAFSARWPFVVQSAASFFQLRFCPLAPQERAEKILPPSSSAG